jgi:hypothetical protein
MDGRDLLECNHRGRCANYEEERIPEGLEHQYIGPRPHPRRLNTFKRNTSALKKNTICSLSD